MTTLKRVVGALLALFGAALAAVGLWFAVHLESNGAATFSVAPSGVVPVVLEPSVLNRLDVPVQVTATSRKGGPVWMGLAVPSDAKATLGEGAYMRLSRVDVQPWTAVLEPVGFGPAPEVEKLEVWRNQSSGTGTATQLVEQANAPETLVISAGDEGLASVELTVVNKSWFVKATFAALLGLVLLAGGLLMLWASRSAAGKEESA